MTQSESHLGPRLGPAATRPPVAAASAGPPCRPRDVPLGTQAVPHDSTTHESTTQDLPVPAAAGLGCVPLGDRVFSGCPAAGLLWGPRCTTGDSIQSCGTHS